MRIILSLLLAGVALILGECSADPTWNSIPSVRAGQIDSVTSLMTAQDTNSNTTDITFNFYTPINTGTNVSQLQYGVSLMSYQSWMTDTFSFNISMTNYTFTGATIRFLVLDNTFFTSAKVHYIVIWSKSPDNGIAGQYNMEVIYGCYLTNQLLASPTSESRNQTVGGLQESSIASSMTYPFTQLVFMSMISGIRLSNNIGNNDYVKITPYFQAATTSYINYFVEVQSNNLLTFFCASTVIAVPTTTQLTYLDNIQYHTYTLTATSIGLGAVPYNLRYDGSDRMFFGISEFNLSMSDTRFLNVETANISLVSLLYTVNSALNKVTYNAFFFAQRSCISPAYYDPVNYTCLDNSTLCVNSYAAGSPGYVCSPCHYSCSLCTAGGSSTSCSACPPNSNRNANSTTCPCSIGFADIGVSVCQLCNVTLVGCLSCTSNLTCILCDPNQFNLTGSSCSCIAPNFMATGYCLSYPGCLIAGYYNNIIACKTCDSGNNFTLSSNFSCICYPGYFLDNSTNKCTFICGQGITPYGRCDDANNITGDGCSNCTVQAGYYCTNITSASGIPGLSVCEPILDITITYLYAEKKLDTNSFLMAFSITPAQSGLTSNSFDKNFNSTLPISSQKITCDPNANIIYLTGLYLQDIQGTTQTAYISFNNMSFYANDRPITFTATGINAMLVIDQFSSSNLILEYIVAGEALIALLLAIFSSIVGLKIVGIELLIPVQIIYFTLATIPQQRSYNSVLNNLKYANGYNTMTAYDYKRTYMQDQSLVSMNYETQFLLSTNIMLGIFVIILFWLLIHHFRLKYKEYKLQTFLEANSLKEPQQQGSVDSEQDREDPEQDQQKMKLKKKKNNHKNSQLQKQESKLRQDHHRSFKVFAFEVDRIYFIFYLILINQMMFGFIIMTLNVPISIFNFAQEINVLVCNFIFFIFIGNIVFISYDQESNKMIAFTCIKDRYAYAYILFDFIIITTLSMTFSESFSTYVVCALTSSFTILVIRERPYSSDFLTLENIVALYLQIMLVVSQVILCMMRTNTAEKTALIYTLLIMALIAIGQILTIIRIVVRVNFKKAFDDLKNPHKDEDKDKKTKKVIEKNLDLLEEDKNVSIVPPQSVRNGLFAPKDKMVDWQSKNTEEYESIKQREVQENDQLGENLMEQEEQGSENKGEKLNELEILKKRLRNNLKLKKDQDMMKKAI